MEVLKDALTVNKKAFENTLKSIKNVPIIALVLIVYTILQALFNLLISPLNILANGMIAGIIRYVFNILLLSNLLGILFSVVNYNRITKNDLTSGFQTYKGQLMNTYFIFYLAEWVIYSFVNTLGYGGLNTNVLSSILLFIIMFIKSPIFEMIYLDNSYGMDAIRRSLAFIKDNFLQWGVINIIFVIFYQRFFQVFIYGNLLLKGPGLGLIIRVLLSLCLIAFGLVYKGQLFSILNNSSMRKRKFQGMF